MKSDTHQETGGHSAVIAERIHSWSERMAAEHAA